MGALDQSGFIGRGDGLYAIPDAQRFENRRNVDLDGLLGEPEREPNFLVRTPFGK
jgi:hypothetical protein